jgi:hypothetical protein
MTRKRNIPALRAPSRAMLAALLTLGAASLAPSATADNLFAVVDMSGGLVAGNGVAAVDSLGIGIWEVTFNRNVESCAYVATTANAHSQALAIFTAGGHLSNNGVYVETKNQGGGLTPGPFHLLVVCTGAGTGYAVVDYDGTLERSTPGARLRALGDGRYVVKFPFKVADCAFLANVGDPGHAIYLDNTGVYTGSRGGRGVYIETKNPGGGLQGGIPFHLGVVCPSAPQTSIAVVKANGTLRRGSPGTSSSRTSLGHYAVATNKPNVGACAQVATRGSVNFQVPFNPTTVEIIPGPAANSVGIDERELLFFGGDPFDEAFHLAVACAPATP